MNITTWFQLGTVGMVLGTLAMLWAMRRVPREKYRESMLLIAVGGIAAVAYAILSLGIGTITAADGHTVYLARYIDWLLTTPLNVAYLVVIAGASKRLLAEVGIVQALTIVFGMAGAIVAPPFKWVFFAIGGLLFARVLQLLYGPVAAEIQGESDSLVGLYRKLLNFIAVLWMVYPVTWILAPSGLGVMDLETQSLVISYIDVVAKIGFGLIALNGQAVASYLSASDEDEPNDAGGTSGDAVAAD
ncbi:bacteriorhodopsin [Halorientalis marina]|jgi:sensory rhodopsin|uniref:bacteriorhodopsin n=1 Tax=Halorientalis marina TaxID=2931976 RepID=UPI001FF5F5EB|nr:bacteriorhodopsin [Halorientalis marina]